MSSPELVSRLEDILEAIAAIDGDTSGKTFGDHAAERLLRDAVERNIERISEASRHIPETARARHPVIEWQKVAGIGNILRHAHPIVDDGVVWEVVARDLGPSKASVERMLKEIVGSGMARRRSRRAGLDVESFIHDEARRRLSRSSC